MKRLDDTCIADVSEILLSPLLRRQILVGRFCGDGNDGVWKYFVVEHTQNTGAVLILLEEYELEFGNSHQQGM
jgi:hypothetical protein